MAHVSKLLPKSVGPPPASSDDHREVLASSFLVNVRIGEGRTGRTAEVLRNLCFQIYWLADQSSWKELVAQIRSLFGVRLNPPEFIKERGQITMSHDDGGTELDLVSSGRGLQQTLLLLAHLYTHPRTILPCAATLPRPLSRRRHAPRLSRATIRQFDVRIKARRPSDDELFDLDELPAKTALDTEISASHGMIQG